MIGSWAGEIGQTQFLPTRYLDHAVDYDGDGRIDLFRDDDDVIGSTANYMHHLGWRPNEPWLEEVRVTGELPWQEADLAIKHPLSKWAGWGMTRMDGSPLPTNSNLTASLLLPMGRNGPAFLAYPNFDIYTEWNNSLTYATTAAYLATRIDGASADEPRARADLRPRRRADAGAAADPCRPRLRRRQDRRSRRGEDADGGQGHAVEARAAAGFLSDARAARRRTRRPLSQVLSAA